RFGQHSENSLAIVRMKTIQPPLRSHRFGDRHPKQPFDIFAHNSGNDVVSIYFKDIKNGRAVSEQMLELSVRRAQFFLSTYALSHVNGSGNAHRDIAPNDGTRANLRPHNRSI